MAFTSKISLFDENPGYGADSGNDHTNEKTVWCKIERTTMNSTFKALAAGVEIQFQILMWEHEYADQQFAEINSTAYKIINATRTDNDLIIRLLLSRG